MFTFYPEEHDASELNAIVSLSAHVANVPNLQNFDPFFTTG